MKKYFTNVTVIAILIFVLPHIALSNCENLPFFDTESNKLELPCINIGENSCIRATLSLSVEGQYVYFDIDNVSQTNQPVSFGEESLLTPIFYRESGILEIPYVKVGGGVVEVFLKLNTVNIGGVSTNFFELQSARDAILPSICRTNVASCWMNTEDNGAMLACYEFSGSSSFIEVMMSGTCANVSGRAYNPCPEGAIYSCSYDISQGNKITLYSYDSNNPLPCSGLGNILPFSF